MAKLLIVDDHPMMGDTIQYILEKNCPEMEYLGQAFSGQKGLEIAHAKQPDILLADIMMPGMDGLTMTQLLKVSFPRIKIVIVTAFEDFDFIQKALRIGAADYLLKPFKPEVLLSILDRLNEELKREVLHPSFPSRIPCLYQKLTVLIKTGQTEQIPCLFQDIWYQLIADSQESIHLVRSRSTEIAEALLQLSQENSFCPEALELIFSSFITRNNQLNNLETLEQSLLEYLFTISKFFRQCHLANENEQITLIRNFIEANLDKTITLESIAREVFLSPSYISRLFKTKMKINFIDYLVESRLHRAKTLILTTNETIESISIQTGYDKANSFRRIFKKRTGLSPSEYKALHNKLSS